MSKTTLLLAFCIRAGLGWLVSSPFLLLAAFMPYGHLLLLGWFFAGLVYGATVLRDPYYKEQEAGRA